jgi:hypothetical protein
VLKLAWACEKKMGWPRSASHPLTRNRVVNGFVRSIRGHLFCILSKFFGNKLCAQYAGLMSGGFISPALPSGHSTPWAIQRRRVSSSAGDTWTLSGGIACKCS